MNTKSYGSSRVQSNLIQQNCFVRDCSQKTDLQSVVTDKKFYSLDEKPSDNGFSYELNEYPYPITPQYVNSFIDSSDYRKDPANAISNGSKHVNLGDIRSIQDLSKLDTSVQRSLYESLKSKFSSQSVQTPSVQTPSVHDTNSSEVK